MSAAFLNWRKCILFFSFLLLHLHLLFLNIRMHSVSTLTESKKALLICVTEVARCISVIKYVCEQLKKKTLERKNVITLKWQTERKFTSSERKLYEIFPKGGTDPQGCYVKGSLHPKMTILSLITYPMSFQTCKSGTQFKIFWMKTGRLLGLDSINCLAVNGTVTSLLLVWNDMGVSD